jgi:hypothetical protein
VRMAWLGVVVLSVSGVGCAAPALAARPRVSLQVRSVRDEDTGLETSEWHVEARTPESGRAWLTGSDGALVELAREPGLFRGERRERGPTAWLDGGRLLLVVAGVVEDGAAVDDAVLARDEGLDETDLVSTAVELPPPPPRPALEGLHAGPDGPGVRWRVEGGAPAWYDLVVSDALTGGTVFRSLGAGRPSSDGASTLDEPLPAGLLRPDRSYVVELRARSELGLVAVERAMRRTLRLP